MAISSDFRVKNGLVVATSATILGTTVSTSSQTGALIVSGGIGVGGNIRVSGGIQVIGTVTATNFSGNITLQNNLTFNNGGSGASSGSTFNGNSALTVSYNTIGALPSVIGPAGKSYVTHDFNSYPNLYDATFINPSGSSNLPTGMSSVMSYRFIMGVGDVSSRGFDLVGAAESSGNLYIRERSIGTWSRVLHSNNYTTYSPALTGTGATGTWDINITGNAATASLGSRTGYVSVWDGTALQVGSSSISTSGGRSVDLAPNTYVNGLFFEFKNSSFSGTTGGNYGGLITVAPWYGTTGSTGDPNYQLTFSPASANSTSAPTLRVRSGIDTTWGAWSVLLHSSNYNSYAPTLTGGGASGTWGISITGNAVTVNTIQRTTNSIYYPVVVDSNNAAATAETLYTTSSFVIDTSLNNLEIGVGAGASTTTGSNNTFIGFNAGFCNTTGNNNIFIGSNSGFFNTFGSNNFFAGQCAGYNNTTGQFNTFIGHNSGLNNTTGSHNTFIGRYAGRSNTEGNYNNFFGQYAGLCNTTGSSNVFFGRYAGQANTIGNNSNFFGREAGRCNTFIGCNNNFFGLCSGRNNTTGTNNNFIGDRTGLSNTIGSFNNFFGRYAGCRNTSGCYNNFIGSYAGRNNTTGNSNNFIGQEAGLCNTSGSYNNFFGRYAGRNNTTGIFNNFIGFHAGRRNTFGNNNNFIGRYAGACNTTGSNNIFIGPSAGFCNTIGSQNTFIGRCTGFTMTGSCNTIIGGFCGNQSGLNLTACSNHIVISDGAGTPRFVINNSGSWGANGANYGTSGQVLTSNGSSSVPTWQSPSTAPTMNVVTGTTQTAVANNHYVLTNAAASTLTLPASPSAGDIVWITAANDLTTNVIARNGEKIMGLSEDLTIDIKNATIQLRFVNTTLGWRIL